MNVGDESFSLFETQMVKPSHEVITISSQEDVEVLKEKPVVTKTPQWGFTIRTFRFRIHS
jgi:hypothetical protein